MAKISQVVRNQQRQQVVVRYAARRAELKALLASPRTPTVVKQAAATELRRQPRDASATRVRRRDAIDGRPRGHLRAFGVSRIRLRGLAHAGHLPGVRKASW